MGLKTRKLLFLFFILAFVIITPLVSLYAAGYKFSLSGKLLQKTGMLIIDSSPDEATILINGKVQQNFISKIKTRFSTYKQNPVKTPAKIKGLLPGEYTIKLEKDGYWSWEKKLQIYPGNSTFAEDVVMFKNNLPQPIIGKNIITLKESPNKKYLAFIGEEKYYVYNTENEEMLYYKKNGGNVENRIVWLNNQKVLFDKMLFSINTWNKPNNLESSLNEVDTSKLQLKNNNTLYFLKNNNITELSLGNKAIKTIYQSSGILNYLIKDNLIYSIEELDNEIFLMVHSNDNLIRKINLNYDKNYNFTNTKSDLLNIYNSKYKTLYLVEPLDYFSPLKETINNVKNSFWVGDNKLVYYNDYEIWIYDKNKTKKTLITRISEKINKILWHPSNNYIIYSTDTSLFTIELDNREKYSTNNLIHLKNINYLSINSEGDYLYFYAQLGRQSNLFKLAI